MHADFRVREMNQSALRSIRTPSAHHLRMPVERYHEFSSPGMKASVVPDANQKKTIMKTNPFIQTCLRFQAVTAVITALIILPTTTIVAEEDESFPENIIEKTRQLEDRMSDKFRDTWKELRESLAAKTHSSSSLSSAAVDVREQNDGYTIRVSLPGRDIDKVEVGMINGNQLRIFAPANGKTGPYEQIVVLAGVSADTKPEIKKRPTESLIVIHLSKAPAAAEKSAAESPETPSKPLSAPLDRWDRDILARMERMRREMDEMFRQSVEDFGAVSGVEDLFDHSRFGSSVDLKEENGNYVIHAYLPDRDAKNLKVTVDDGRILKIEAEAEERTEKKQGAMVMERKSHYSQYLTLPGPVDADQLKVDRKDGILVITVPKKTEG